MSLRFHPAGHRVDDREWNHGFHPACPDQPRRGTISPAQKVAYLQGYEQAIQSGEGRGYLRANGLHSS